MLELIFAVVAVNVAYIVFLDRRDQRERVERAHLLQRIQAPEAAVYQHATQHAPEDQGAYPATDEEIAEQQERDRVLAFIERHEA